LAEKRWDETSIGVVMSIAVAAEIPAPTPADALWQMRARRTLMVLEGAQSVLSAR
jgi:hypothetical protein